jgi:hypothetical protein
VIDLIIAMMADDVPDLPPSYPQFEARDYCPIVVSNPLLLVSSCDPHGTKVDPMDVDESHPLPAACDDVDDHVSESIVTSTHQQKELNDPMDWVYTSMTLLSIA